MAQRKLTYKKSDNKKQVREFLFSLFANKQLNKIVGLAGPDIDDYLQFCKSKGYDEFEIYENHFPTAVEQIRKLRTHKKVNIRFGDILQANPDNDKVLFDLDYCATVRTLTQHISKFNYNFIMTFSRRVADTIETFFNSRNERILKSVEYESPVQHTVFTTKKGKYIYVPYYDTSSMCCIAKIN